MFSQRLLDKMLVRVGETPTLYLMPTYTWVMIGLLALCLLWEITAKIRAKRNGRWSREFAMEEAQQGFGGDHSKESQETQQRLDTGRQHASRDDGWYHRDDSRRLGL